MSLYVTTLRISAWVVGGAGWCSFLLFAWVLLYSPPRCIGNEFQCPHPWGHGRAHGQFHR